MPRSTPLRTLLGLLALLGLGGVPLPAQGLLDAKQIAAPASDLASGRLRLPDPAETGLRSRTARLAVRVVDGRAVVTVPVEGDAPLAFAFLAPPATEWRVTVARPGAAALPLARLAAEPGVERRAGDAAPLAPGRFAERYDVAAPAAGAWTFTVESPRRDAHEGELVLASASPRRLYAHLADLELSTARPVGVRAWLYDARESAADGVPWPAGAQGSKGAQGPASAPGSADAQGSAGAHGLASGHGAERVTVAVAGGEPVAMTWRPEGWYEALVPVLEPGAVTLRVTAYGRGAEGTRFVRTADLRARVHAPTVALDGTVTPRLEPDGRLRLELGARLLAPAPKLQLGAEVWGRDELGAARPACWIGGMVAPEPTGGDAVALSLWLDPRWIDHAGLGGPLELRAVRVQDPDSHAPLARADVLALADLPLALPAPRPAGSPAPPVVPAMLVGTAGAQLVPGPAVAATRAPAPRPFAPRALMLVHGYCSSGTPWPAGDFTGSVEVFVDADQNRTHDEFAGLIAAFGATRGLGSFGVVGHSQGGPAALHLYTYYWSGLDLAAGGRRIQSLGSPYQGTPLASLGGFSCGVNDDMTPAGSALWLAGIPSWARDDVWYWTTSFAGSWCDFFSNLILTNPEDGVVERFRALLPGGHDMGNTVGWCHTTGMSEPAQYTDHARNAVIDAAAAR